MQFSVRSWCGLQLPWHSSSPRKCYTGSTEQGTPGTAGSAPGGSAVFGEGPSPEASEGLQAARGVGSFGCCLLLGAGTAAQHCSSPSGLKCSRCLIQRSGLQGQTKRRSWLESLQMHLSDRGACRMVLASAGSGWSCSIFANTPIVHETVREGRAVPAGVLGGPQGRDACKVVQASAGCRWLCSSLGSSPDMRAWAGSTIIIEGTSPPFPPKDLQRRCRSTEKADLLDRGDACRLVLASAGSA